VETAPRKTSPKRLIVGLFVLIFGSIACTPSDVLFQEFTDVPSAGWERDSAIQFDLAIDDTVQPYVVLVTVRHTDEYPFRNCYLGRQVIGAHGIEYQDTVEIQLADAQGHRHAMAGLLPFSAERGALSLGYRDAIAAADGLLTRAGERCCGHEFHRWQLHRDAAGPVVASRFGLWQLEGWGCSLHEEGWTAPNVHASWLHLHWAGCPEIPRRLVAAAATGDWPQPAGAFCSPASPASPPSASAGVCA
jgi:hypothetical protein